jgi:hypothetical protein
MIIITTTTRTFFKQLLDVVMEFLAGLGGL